MDATRVMTTAALSVAMASLFAPPVAGWMSAPSPRPASQLEISAIPSDAGAVGRLAFAARAASAGVACEPPAKADGRLAALPHL